MGKKYYIYIVIFFLLLLPVTIIKAADLSDYFSVENIKICANDNCTSYYDENNGIEGSKRFAVKFDWYINSEVAIKDGDIIKVPFANEIETEDQTRFTCLGFSWSDIYDENSNKIGKWMMDGDESDRIITIKFSDSAVGKTSLRGTFITAKNIYGDFSYVDKVVHLTVGNKKSYFKINTLELVEINDGANTSVTSTSNNMVSLLISSPSASIKQLYDVNNYTDINSFSLYNDLYLEFPIPEYLNASIEKFLIRATIVSPVSLTEMKASGHKYTMNITSDFTEIYQNNGETYNDFKNRMKKFEYGFFNDGNNNTLIINYGSQPSLDKTYDYYAKLIDSSFSGPGDYFHSVGSFVTDSTMKDFFNKTFGNSNRIAGKVVLWGLSIKLKFPTVVVPTTKQVKSIWSWKDIDGNVRQQQVTNDIKLVVPSSIAALQGESKILLRDKDSKNEIVGVKIKLQKKNGDTFVDVDEAITDSTGVVLFRNLESGVYRYVQTSYLDHYKTNSFKMYSDASMNNVISEFEFDANSGNIIYATNEREKYKVTYKKGTHGTFDNQVYSDIPYGDSTPYFEPTGEDEWIFKGWNPDYELFVTDNATYTALWKKMVNVTTRYLELGTNNVLSEDVIDINDNDTNYETEKKEIENYEFVRVDGNTSGIRGEEDIVVTYYYKKKESNLNVKYLDCNTKREIANSTNEIVYYGDNYDADTYEANVIIPENYNRISANKTDNYKGVVDSDNINVEYCYNKKDSKLNTSITMTGTDKITKSKDKVSYQINYNTVFTDYIGEATIKIVDTLPYKIDVNESNLDGGVYDEDTKTITWNVNTNINSYENSEYNVTKNIELKYKNINLLEDVIVNNVSGKTEIENKNKEVTTHYNTYIDIKGTIVVKYLENNTNKELIDSITTTDNVGKEYEFVNKDIEGYRLVKKPTKEKEEYKEETQEFKFLYERIKYKITVTSNEGGNVTGDEEVYYNEDSKEDNIKIKANDNYYIKEIRINEKVIKIPENSKELTIPQFKNMMEDKKIEVVFDNVNEKVIVPNTLKKSMLIIFGIITLLGSMGIMLYILYSKEIVFKKHQ